MKLGLGAVQLGLPYGLANSSGKPGEEESAQILKEAWENGIDAYDTAASYGDSEKRIGSFIAKNQLEGKIKISTKTGGFDWEGGQLEDKINRCVEDSLKNLRLNMVDYYLLHSPKDIFRYGKEIVRVFSGLKQNKLIKKIGVSVYNSDEIRECLLYPEIECIQIPFNLLDQRLPMQGLLKEMKNRGIEIHARSIFLQGLITMESDKLPPHLQPAGVYLEQMDRLAAKHNLGRKELAFIYVRDNQYVDRMFVGCERIEQLRDNLRINSLPPLKNGLPEEDFAGLDESLLNPALWKL